MGKIIDLTGKRFGKLTVIKKHNQDKWGGWNWLCMCDCGNETVVSGGHLRGLKTKSCGCSRKETKNFTHKMTDNEIIKALKSDIRLADYIDSDYCGDVDKALIQSAINSINRLQAKVIKEQNKNSKLRNERNHLQAEIERLKECPKCVYEYDGEITEYCTQVPCPNFKTVEQIKAEAYKEFAERLKENINKRFVEDNTMIYWCVHIKDIDNLLKEMAGENNDL